MSIKKKIGYQKGGALIVALILTSVGAVVTMTAMRGSLMQEKMVANQNLKAVSYMAAESGAASFNKWLLDPNTTWNTTTWQNSVPTTAAGNINIGSKGYYWINPSDVVWGANSVTLKVRGYAKSDNSATANAKTTLQITLTKPSNGGTGTYIGSGMIAGGDIDIKGNATISGSAMANGDFSVSGGNSNLTNGTVSAAGKASMKGVAANLVNSGVAAVTVPVITAAWLTTMQAKANVQSCSLNLSGDQSGKIYYCSGNASVSGSFSNATIIASGTMTSNGAGQLGGGSNSASANTVAIIAGGSITANGSSNNNAVFWTNGNFTQNGSSSLSGTIVAGGNIRRNGVFTFTNATLVQNPVISTVPNAPARVALWQEILE